MFNMGVEVKCVTDVTKKDTPKMESTLFQISHQTIDRGTLVVILIERVYIYKITHTFSGKK